MTLDPIKEGDSYAIRIPFFNPLYDPDPNSLTKEDKPAQGSDEEEDDYHDRMWEWEHDFRVEHLVLPEPGVFQKPNRDSSEALGLRQRYSHRGLQIIVKLASIHLTPDKPGYEGGTWHVEGQMNEHICATALYYYDSDNITESRLAFRQHGGDEATIEFGYEQFDHAWLEPVFGLEQGGTTVQDVGDVICKEGRLLTFPNILQHQVQPFKLEDPSKPGHRKILALFLVDPNIRVISTANVPPQQRDWWSEEVLSTGVFDRLAKELQDKTFKSVDNFPIGLDEAKLLRLELINERKDFVVKQNNVFNSFTISLCEH
jgi:Protein of unknown function (DUF4246)